MLGIKSEMSKFKTWNILLVKPICGKNSGCPESTTKILRNIFVMLCFVMLVVSFVLLSLFESQKLHILLVQI